MLKLMLGRVPPDKHRRNESLRPRLIAGVQGNVGRPRTAE